jgi:glycosyltransferase involved in cell wall biosynthesis
MPADSVSRFPVSVVVPVRDEAATIELLLDSLAAQVRPPEEIVVVDGGSRDQTPALVARRAAVDPRVRLVRTGDAFPGVGRNRGVEAARHDVIAFTDAGIRVDPRWLLELCRPMERDPTVGVVYGHLEPVTEGLFAECAALAYVPAPREIGGVRVRAPFIVCCLLRRAVWAGVGGFPPFRAGEDLMFMEAVARSGARVAYTPDAVVHWRLAPGWRATFRRFATYSRHNLRAGRARQWHLGTARLWLAGGIAVVLAVFHHPAWLAVPVLGLAARTGRTAWTKRSAFAFRGVFRPDRLLGLAALLVLLDCATWWGLVRWLGQDRPWRRVAA